MDMKGRIKFEKEAHWDVGMEKSDNFSTKRKKKKFIS